MNFRRQFVLVCLSLALLFDVSCTKKKPQLPPQAKAPAEPVPMPLPREISEAQPPPPPQEPPQPPPPPQEPPKTPPKSKQRKRKPAQPPATAQNGAVNPPANAAPNTSTVAAARPPANPATEAPPDTAIAANVTSAQLLRQKQTTAQLIDDTEKTVNGLNRTLSHDEEEILAQIRSYVAQSRKATTDGDFERAYNLATKAHLLSDALIKK